MHTVWELGVEPLGWKPLAGLPKCIEFEKG
jgi:hypothetical protein